jgi:VWFA-related protein
MRLCPELFPAIFLFALTLLIAPCLMGQQPQQPPPVVRSFVNEVLVPVVVRDAQGHAVGNLSKDDFQVIDNGKPQTITGFTIIKRASEISTEHGFAASQDNSDFPDFSQPAPSPPRFVVFLFDIYNLTVADLAQARQAAIKVIDSSLAPADMAAVLSTGSPNSGLTRDHAKLKQMILDLRVKPLSPSDKCPTVDYYHGDLIINKDDGPALQAAVVETLHCFAGGISLDGAEAIVRTAAERAVQLGQQNYRTNLYFLGLVLKGMASLPGQHVVILVSSGFLAPDAEAMTIESEILDMAARSNTVINALDPRGLYTTNQGAEVSVRINQDTEQDIQRLNDRYRRESMAADADVMAELADGTGGTFYHNNNDLEAGFRTLVSGPDYTYLLGFTLPSTKPGVHHNLKVKVNEPGLTVQARRGYSTPAPEKHKK